MKRAKDIKLVIQPVQCELIHEYVFEGPCRFGSGDELTTDFDRMNAAEGFKQFQEKIGEYITCDDFEILTPIECEITEAFEITSQMIELVTATSDKIDCYLFNSVGRAYPIITATAAITKKPIILCPKCCGNTQMPAHLRSRGFECESPLRWEELRDIFNAYRVKKVLKCSKALLLTRGFTNGAPVSCPDGFLNLDVVTEKFGTQFAFLNIHEFIDQSIPRDCTQNTTKPGVRCLNLTAADMDEISAYADSLIANAIECTMSKEDIVHTLRFYKTAKKQLEHYECNCFTCPCPEMCATRRLNEQKYTPCLTHSIFNGEGIPSACEYDVPGLLSQIILSTYAHAGSYLGNTTVVPLENDNITPVLKTNPENGLAEKVKEFDDATRKHLVFMFHASMNIRLKGYDAPAMEYSIHPYTGSKWGATFRYDFAQDIGQVVTMARISPDASKIFVAKGEIVGSIGHDLDGCTQGVMFKVADNEDFYKKQCDFGNHIPIVYGDYVESIVKLAELLGLGVVTA